MFIKGVPSEISFSQPEIAEALVAWLNRRLVTGAEVRWIKMRMSKDGVVLTVDKKQ